MHRTGNAEEESGTEGISSQLIGGELQPRTSEVECDDETDDFPEEESPLDSIDVLDEDLLCREPVAKTPGYIEEESGAVGISGKSMGGELQPRTSEVEGDETDVDRFLSLQLESLQITDNRRRGKRNRKKTQRFGE